MLQAHRPEQISIAATGSCTDLPHLGLMFHKLTREVAARLTPYVSEVLGLDPGDPSSRKLTGAGLGSNVKPVDGVSVRVEYVKRKGRQNNNKKRGGSISFDFASFATRTPHGAHVRSGRGERNRGSTAIDPLLNGSCQRYAEGIQSDDSDLFTLRFFAGKGCMTAIEFSAELDGNKFPLPVAWTSEQLSQKAIGAETIKAVHDRTPLPCKATAFRLGMTFLQPYLIQVGFLSDEPRLSLAWLRSDTPDTRVSVPVVRCPKRIVVAAYKRAFVLSVVSDKVEAVQSSDGAGAVSRDVHTLKIAGRADEADVAGRASTNGFVHVSDANEVVSVDVSGVGVKARPAEAGGGFGEFELPFQSYRGTVSRGE